MMSQTMTRIRDNDELFESVIELDMNIITLEELIVAIGSTFFAGFHLSDIRTEHLERLEELVQAELIIRESELTPTRHISREIH
jgi:hypothetical protein